MPFVLDSSATIPCFAPDELPIAAVEARLQADTVVVPAIWPQEIFNALCMMQRRGRITAAQAATIAEGLQQMTVVVEPANLQRLAEDVYPLAQKHGLSIYDASYLELAIRRDLPLATLDAALIRAARKTKLKLV